MRSFTINGNEVQENFRTVACIVGDDIQDENFRVVMRVNGNRLDDANFQPRATVDGDRIVDSNFREIGTVSDAEAMFPGVKREIAAGLFVLAGSI